MDDQAAIDSGAVAQKRRPKLHELKAVNVADLEWATTRFADQVNKVLSFRDGVVFAVNKFYEDGYTFPHTHQFRQLRYILEGEFIINGKSYGPGTLVDFPEKVVYEVHVPKGGVWIIVQLPGATTGVPPEDTQGFAYGPEPARKRAQSS